MPKQPTEYIHILSGGADRMVVRFLTYGHSIADFCVQYEALIGGRWHKVVRYDSSHGAPHRHTFYPNAPEHRVVMVETSSNEAFTAALGGVKRDFKKLRERYIMSMKKGGQA